MKKQAEKTLLEQVKKTLGGYRDQVSDFWNDTEYDTHAEGALLQGKEFLKNWAVPAGATTLGAGALAGALTAQGERPGETKRERTMRILRNAAITSGATGLGWLGAAGVAGTEYLTDLPRGTKLNEKFEDGPKTLETSSQDSKDINGRTAAEQEAHNWRVIGTGAGAGAGLGWAGKLKGVSDWRAAGGARKNPMLQHSNKPSLAGSVYKANPSAGWSGRFKRTAIPATIGTAAAMGGDAVLDKLKAWITGNE